MKKQIALLSTAVLVMSAPAFANEAKVEAKAQHYMEKIDTNSDSMISKAEHDAFGEKMFNEADTDNNDSISLAELTAHKQKEKDEMKNLEGADADGQQQEGQGKNE